MSNKGMTIETLNIAELNPATYNPRIELQPGMAEYDILDKGIIEFGLVELLVVNKRSPEFGPWPQQGITVVSGHQRLNVLKSQGFTEVQCSVVDLSPSKEKALNLLLNKSRGLDDMPKLKDLLEELNTGEFPMELTGFTNAEIGVLMSQFHPDGPNGTGAEDDGFDPEADAAAIVEPVAKLGEVWVCGEHRIVCGDSTNPEHVAKLLGDEQIDMVITDPPYGVNYVGQGNKERDKIENDNLNDTDFNTLIRGCFDLCQKHSRPGAYWYATAGSDLALIMGADWKKRETLRQFMVWVKNMLVMGRSEYHYRHELILFGWMPGGKRHKNEDRTRTTVWEFDKPRASPDHPTMKPIPFWAAMMNDGSRVGEIVYDPFGGSGTTILAAEQLGRRGRAVELDPRYVDVIVHRWEAYTGMTAWVEKPTADE